MNLVGYGEGRDLVLEQKAARHSYRRKTIESYRKPAGILLWFLSYHCLKIARLLPTLLQLRHRL